jgi:beta-glucosidase
MNQRALREITLKGFEIMVKESDPWTIMSSYNKLNGKYTQQNYELLTTILRDEWGFRGIVMTDWGSKDNTVEAVKAGNDLMEPGMDIEIERIVKAVENGDLPVADVDRNVRYMLEYIVKTPRFKGYKYSDNPDLASHARLVREAAAEGLVLLKNEATLPFCKNMKNVALYGITSYDMIAGGTGSGNVNKAYIRNLADGLRENGLTVDSIVEDWYSKYIAFKKADNAVGAARMSILLGDAVLSEPSTPKKLISSRVKDNDIAVVTIGRNAGEGADRTITNGDWTLTAEERELLQNVCEEYHAAGKKVVVVLNIGGVIETASWKNLPDAILLAWTPGQEVGYTVADVLKGKSYPSGKLPMTFPVNYFDIPSSFNFPYETSSGSGFDFSSFFGGRKKEAKKNIDYINYEEGIWVGYRYFTTAKKEVSYPFGYGLSYTIFQYGKPSVKVDKDGNISASVTITNTGKMAGKEVVELYVTAPENGLVKPAYELRSFAKTRELAPGESQTLTMKVDAYTLASFNEAGSCWETAIGKYTAHFGASANDLRCNAAFNIKQARNWKVNNVLAPESPVQEISVTR